MSLKKWTVKQYDKTLVPALMQKYGIGEIMANLLCSRGLTDDETVQEFFSSQNELSDPFLIKDMDKAAQRIRQAIDDGEKICIYGDYDADGVTATVIVYNYLYTCGADVFYYIPNRDTEGYGLNFDAVEYIASKGTNLILTVDNGVSAYNEVELANSLGVDVVVTDHHQPPEKLPNAVAVVDPHREDDTCPFKDFAGVGVALMLLCALEDGMCDMILEQFADIAAIGTVADVVPLVGENRIIVKNGLCALYNTENVGLNALVEKCSLSDKKITAESLAFIIAPKINAAGRMGDVNDAVRLLISEDEEEAEELAEKITSLNAKRKEIEEAILEDINALLKAEPQELNERIIVLSGRGWHHGIIGIVCARLMEKYGKPCILISVGDDGIARASARSIKGFSMIDAITATGEYLTRFGGHEQAAGFSLEEKNIEAFTKAIESYAREHFLQMPPLSITVDKLLSPREMQIDAIKQLEMFEPFGCENEKPNFAMAGAKIEAIIALSHGKHTRLRLNKDGVSFGVLWFGEATDTVPFSAGDLVDICFGCEVGEYNNIEQLTFKLKDIRPSGIRQDVFFASQTVYDDLMCGYAPKDTADIPSREEIGMVYKFLRQNNGYPHSSAHLYASLMKELSYAKMMLALQIMKELNLISGDLSDKKMNLKLIPQTGKLDLNASELFCRIHSINE